MVVRIILLIISFSLMPCVAISICGEGYFVGKPSASITLSQRSSVRCSDLETLVVDGLQLPPSYKEQKSLIHEVCECLPSMKQENRILDARLERKILYSSPAIRGNRVFQEMQKQTRNQKEEFYATRPDVAAPTISPSSRNLQNNPTNFWTTNESPIWNTPTYYPSMFVYIPPTNSNESSPSLLYVGVGMLLLFVCCCFVGLVNCQTGTNNPAVLSPVSNPAVVSTPEPQETEESLKAQRRIVIEMLFPIQGNDTQLEEGTAKEKTNSGRKLKYDSSSKKYIFSNEKTNQVQCSICLDDADEDLIFGKCSHMYHRACIMQWMLDGHDECPNCRQLMWDPEAYKYVEECVKEHGLSTFVTKQ